MDAQDAPIPDQGWETFPLLPSRVGMPHSLHRLDEIKRISGRGSR